MVLGLVEVRFCAWFTRQPTRWRLRYNVVLKDLEQTGHSTCVGLWISRMCWRRLERLLYTRPQTGHGLGSSECSFRLSHAATKQTYYTWDHGYCTHDRIPSTPPLSSSTINLQLIPVYIFQANKVSGKCMN